VDVARLPEHHFPLRVIEVLHGQPETTVMDDDQERRLRLLSLAECLGPGR
jgi:hypothetical protein